VDPTKPQWNSDHPSPAFSPCSATLENLRSNRKSSDRSRLFSPSCSAIHPNFSSVVGDEVAPFSAARQSAELATNASISTRSFGSDCAALRGSREESYPGTPRRRVQILARATGAGAELARRLRPAPNSKHKLSGCAQFRLLLSSKLSRDHKLSI